MHENALDLLVRYLEMEGGRQFPLLEHHDSRCAVEPPIFETHLRSDIAFSEDAMEKAGHSICPFEGVIHRHGLSTAV